MAFNNNKGELQFPYDIIDVDPEINSELLRDFTGMSRMQSLFTLSLLYQEHKIDNFFRRKNWVRSSRTGEIFLPK